jgi:hypothetical protein
MSTFLNIPVDFDASDDAIPLPILRRIAQDRGLHVEEMVCPVCGRERNLYAVSHVATGGGSQLICTGSSLEEAYLELLELLELPRERPAPCAWC